MTATSLPAAVSPRRGDRVLDPAGHQGLLLAQAGYRPVAEDDEPRGRVRTPAAELLRVVVGVAAHDDRADPLGLGVEDPRTWPAQPEPVERAAGDVAGGVPV